MSSPIPTLAEVQEPLDYLTETAKHLNQLAANRTDTMGDIWRSAQDLNWVGQGKDGMTARMIGHGFHAATSAQIFRAQAAAAQEGYAELFGQQQAMTKTVQSATNGGYQVGSDYSISDPTPDPYGVRQGIARGIQTTLIGQAAAFGAQQAKTAAGMAGPAAGLAGASPEGMVQCRDYGMTGGEGGVIAKWKCWEVLPDGGLFTWNDAGGDLSGMWPD